MKQAFESIFFKGCLAVAVALLGGLLVLHFGILRTHQQEMTQKEATWQSEQDTVRRLTRMKQVQGDFSRFLASLPTVNQLPQLSAFLAEKTDLNHLPPAAVSYRSESTKIPGIVAVQTALHLEGEYRDLRKLIDDLERSRYFLVIQNIGLSTSGSEAATVQLKLDLASYMREH